MPHIHDAIFRLHSLSEAINLALAGEFPYPEPRLALENLLVGANDNLQDLQDELEYETSKRREICDRADSFVREMSQLVGLLVRSTNVRNSFELIWPFQELCARLFAPEKKRVILSSEWQYIPFLNTISPFTMRDFAFIGLPATEAHNPLIIPAAAHEIGHSYWLGSGTPSDLNGRIDEAIKATAKLLPRPSSSALVPSIARQVQELFCDLVGVGLFGTSYMHTFAYLLPTAGQFSGTKLHRASVYPSNLQRAKQMALFAEDNECIVPNDFLSRYDEPNVDGVAEDEQFIQFVDIAVGELAEFLRQYVRTTLEDRSLLRKDRKLKSLEITEAFKENRPFRHPESLADIVDAAWILHLERKRARPGFEDLSNLVLKTIEIYEFSQRK